MRMLRCGIFTMLCGTLVLPVYGASESSSDAIESGRQSLESRRHLPWYDVQQDRLRRIDVEPSEDDMKRHSRWAFSDLRKPSRTRSTGWWSFFWSILRVLAWLGLGLLVALVIWALVWAATRGERAAVSGGEVVREVEAAEPHLEDLPVPVSPRHMDLLAAARAYFEAGDLGKAIIHAFAHQLVELDKHHLIQLTRGKTNRQYISELRAHPRFIELLRPTMLAFEDVFFGHHELARQRFQACWEDLDRFHQQLEQVAL